MKTIALIAEYNPLHNGHLKQIEYIKANFGSDCRIIVIMSGNFVQRGEPACLDKYKRAKLAVKAGAALILELPVVFATASAREFARAAIKLIDSLNVVTDIICGVESIDLRPTFDQLACYLLTETPEYKTVLNKYLSQSLNFPQAREKALSEIFPEDKKAISAILNNPNNILALEYLLALKDINSKRAEHGQKDLLLHFSPRFGKQENDPELTDNIVSATAIRQFIQANKVWSKSSSTLESPNIYAGQNKQEFIYNLENKLPASVLANLINSNFAQYENYPKLAEAILFVSPAEELAQYRDFSLDLANNLKNSTQAFFYANKQVQDKDFFTYLASSYFPLTRIQRSILARLLQIRADEWEIIKQEGPAFINVLACDKNGQYLLRLMRKLTKLPVVVKNSDLLERLNNNRSTSKIQQNINLTADALFNFLQADYPGGIFAEHLYIL